MKAKEDKEKKNTAKDVRPAPTSTGESDEWLKKLGAVPADQHFEESPEIARIQATLSGAERDKPTDPTTEQKDFTETMAEWLCHHVTPNMLREESEKRLDIICPAKEYLARAKIWFKDTLTESQKGTAVEANCLPCHLCPKYYKAGVEGLSAPRIRQDQAQFLREFDLWEERRISKPNYSEGTNSNRRRAAEALEKRKLMQVTVRLMPNPKNLQKPERTLMATLSVLGWLESGKAPQRFKNDPSEALLEKAKQVTALYAENLRTEIERLKQFITTRQQQRSQKGQQITEAILELERQYKFIMEYDAASSS